MMSYSSKPIDVVITSWMRESITVTTLNCLRKNTQFPIRIILIDSGSDIEYANIYAKLTDVYVRMDKNRGLEYAKHLGMQFVESDLFVSTDNDILVPKIKDDVDWLQRLIKVYNANPEFKSIALRPQVLVGTGDIFGDNPPDVLEFSHVPGYMRLMDSTLVNKLGAWNEFRDLRGHEEYWITERINKAGFKAGWASNIPCWHLWSDDGNWGYGKMKTEEHGHKPTQLPKDDWTIINKDFI